MKPIVKAAIKRIKTIKPKNIAKSELPVLTRADAEFRGIRQYTPAQEVRPARTKKPPSALRKAVREGVMTAGEAAETALKNRYYKKQGIKVKTYVPAPKSKPLKPTGFSPDFKPYVPPKPVEVQVRSMTRSKNAAMFSGVKTQDYDAFVKSLGKTSAGSKRLPLKVDTPKGTKRDLTFRYDAAEVVEKARTGQISQNRLKSWVLASTNRLSNRASELAKQEAELAKQELKAQKARGVVRKEKAIERKKLYQSPETKRFREEKAKSKSSVVIYAAEKHGKITFPDTGNQRFVRVSEEAYRLSKEAEKIALKNKVAAEGQQSFAEALKNVESGAKVEVRRKVTEKELATAFENVQKEATILEKPNMPKVKVKPAAAKAPAKKGGKAQLVKPKPKMELTPENLAKVLASDAPKAAGKGKAGKAAKPAATKPAEAPKAKVKPQATGSAPKVKVKAVATPAPVQEAPKAAAKVKPAAKAPTGKQKAPSGKTKAPKVNVVKASNVTAMVDDYPKVYDPFEIVESPKPYVPTLERTPSVTNEAPKVKAKTSRTPKTTSTGMVPVGARNDAKSRAAAGDARATGVRTRANAAELELKARQKAAKMASSGSWKKRLVGGVLVTAGSLLGGAGLGYLTSESPAPVKPPVPQKRRTNTGKAAQQQASGTTTAQAKAAPPAKTVAQTRADTKVAPKSKLSGFGAAFKEARKARLSGKAGDTFQYGGKTYTSYQKGEQPKAKAPAVAKASNYGEESYKQHEAFRKEMEAGLVTAQPAMSAAQLEEQFKKKKGPR